MRVYYTYRFCYVDWDQSWISYPLYICSAVEINLGVVCTSIPPCRPLLGPLLSKTFTFLSGSISSLRPSRSDDLGESSQPSSNSASQNINTTAGKRFSYRLSNHFATDFPHSHQALARGAIRKPLDTDSDRELVTRGTEDAQVESGNALYRHNTDGSADSAQDRPRREAVDTSILSYKSTAQRNEYELSKPGPVCTHSLA